MCGLVGYAALRAPVDAERLAAMRDRLAHRGPDDAGLFTHADDHAAVGFGHRRLSIIDTRTVGRQPMATRDGRQVIVFNGEIYNFAAIRERLATRHDFETRTDTEVLLYLYRERGEQMLGELAGMFAFALWDADAKRLFVARDRVGKKPLYLADVGGGTLLFASEIKALLASGLVDDAVDLQAHHDYLALNYVPGPRTMFRGVTRLPPAHALVWEAGRTRTFRYWDPVFHSVGAPRTVSGLGAAARAVRETLDRAVQRRLVSDVPLGMFLSGGIDSTAVLASMAHAGAAPRKAFTIRFEEASYDESAYARYAARKFGAEHHEEVVRPDADTFLGPLTDAFDEPYADSSAIPLWYLCRLARRHVTVALGGDGGDELFAGYRTHVAWRLAHIYRALPPALRDRWLPALVKRLPVSHAKVSFDLKARQFVAAATRPVPDAHFGFKEFLSEEARRDLVGDRGAALEPTARLFREAFAAHDFRDGLDGVLYSDLRIYLPDDILVKVDRMSMNHGLEARAPFLDHELIELAASLPASYKLPLTRTKHVLKQALWGRVPLRILERGKAGFNVPMARWLLGELRPLLRDMLAGPGVQRLGLWRPEAVESLLREHEERRRDRSRTLWAMLAFVLWNERHRSGRAA